MKEHNKSYPSINEYLARYNTFKSNYLKIESMTLDPESKVSHRVGITKFMDMTTQEFRRTYLNLKISPANSFGTGKFLTYLQDAPESVDFRTQGLVGPVKDQGKCGSCWAFSTVGNLEGQYAKQHGKLLQFAEQQLVDCDTESDQGCGGGLMGDAFDYIQQAGGLELQQDYPYHARDEFCKFDNKKVAVKVTGKFVKEDMDEKEMAALLASTGPLAIALNADPLQFYDGGILVADEYECDPNGLNHGVTLVGYGSEDGQDYWIVKNSWSASWGEDGYFRIARGSGTCGINAYVSGAIIE
jgi:C1A family cysteine protease